MYPLLFYMLFSIYFSSGLLVCLFHSVSPHCERRAGQTENLLEAAAYFFVSYGTLGMPCSPAQPLRHILY